MQKIGAIIRPDPEGKKATPVARFRLIASTVFCPGDESHGQWVNEQVKACLQQAALLQGLRK